MTTRERIDNILSDRDAYTAWVKDCYRKGYDDAKICRLNDAMINASSIMASGRQLELQNNRVWLGYSINTGEMTISNLKENESVEIYHGRLGYCQIKVANGEPVKIIQYGDESPWEKSAQEVYGI